VILHVKVNKQLDGKANGVIENYQEIISELFSIQEWGDCTLRESDCEELVGVTHKKDTFTKDTILIKLNFVNNISQ
tara:strand:+ start:73 stop:300 length:228 start_codon:yes stop_codon:yes gene_type:complete